MSDSPPPSAIDPRCPSVPQLAAADFDARVLLDRPPRSATVVAFIPDDAPGLHADMVLLEMLARAGRDVVRVHVEAPDAGALRQRFGLGACPMLLLFVGGALRSVFGGERTATALESWLTYQAGPLPRRPESDGEGGGSPPNPAAQPGR